ncbi:MAG: succinylglutamate desuccinylase/aspartoacylase family protein [Lachnospiraceae bacterium]|jgi:predicted deacylase|nr:succinylglutamate desuccinylase/aspartoacylase family protein [Lachnospiraceae bacterium]
MKKIPRHILTASLLCVFVAVMVVVLGISFRSMKEAEPIYPGPGVTGQEMLSKYCPNLKGTAGDTEIYILDSGVPGASMLVLGGTHPNEPSGFISAISLIETVKPVSGILYVIPRANASAFTCNDPQEGSPQRFTIQTAGGERWFRFGSRATNPIDQWPDSEVYVHASSGQTLSGSEIRNLNRAYPGREDGTLTERVAYGITQFIKQHNVTITVDLHEASPEYTTVNAIVAHEDAMDLATLSLWELEDVMKISVEASPKNLHGLTHRELGDYTDTLALLMETANASQGRLHGTVSAEMVVSGQDKFYYRAGQYGALTVDYPETGIGMSERCARHISALNEFCKSYDGPAGTIDLGEMPSYKEIITNGIGAYLASPK